MSKTINYANWLSGISGDINLADLALPGSHNAACNYLSLENGISLADMANQKVGNWPWVGKEIVDFIRKNIDPVVDAVVGFYALTQESSITEQLNSGIRQFDLRFNYDRATDAMFVAHGTVKYAKLDLIMQEFETWLAAHPSETLIIKPRIYDNPSEEQLQKYFYNRYVYEVQEGANRRLRRFDSASLQNNANAPIDAKQTPLIGKEIYYRGSQLPTLNEARGKIVLLDDIMINGLQKAGKWGTIQDLWDTSSLKGGIPEKIEKFKEAQVAISKQPLGNHNQNHFQLSPGAPKFAEIIPTLLPSSIWDASDYLKNIISNPEKFIETIVNRIFAPITPPLGFAAQLNQEAIKLLESLPPETRANGFWVGDFTDGSSDYFDRGIQAITDALGLPEDTSKLNTTQRISVNIIQTISETLKKSGQLKASDASDAIVRRNLGTIISLSRESLTEGQASELQIHLFNPASTAAFFKISPASSGADKEDVLLSFGSASTTGYAITPTDIGWSGSVARNASGSLTMTALANKDAEEINESFKIELYKDATLTEKIGDAVTLSIAPSSGNTNGTTGTQAYAIRLNIADVAWAGSGDEGKSSNRALSAVTLVLHGINSKGQDISRQIVLDDKSYDRALNNSRRSPFQRGSSDRFDILLDEDFTSIRSVTLQASQANKDRIDLTGLSVEKLQPISENESRTQRQNLFSLNLKTDAVKLTTKTGEATSSRFLYKSGLTTEHAYRIDTNSPIDFEVLPYLAGSNARVTTSKGDVWFHVLDSNGERTPISTTEIDPKLPTFIITHGFTGGTGDNWLAGKLPTFSTSASDWKLNAKDLKQWQAFYGDDHALALSIQEAFRDQTNQVKANVILADWGNFSAIGTGGLSYASYATVAAEHVPAAGRAVADYIKQLGIDPGQVTLLGHSLGGHVMAFAGQSIQEDARNNPSNYQGKAQQINTIVAMDAAGPMFETWAPNKRLSNGDASKVFNIHTDTLMGFDAPLGSHDLYMDTSYSIAHQQAGMSSQDFRTKLENLYQDIEALYAAGKKEEARTKYLKDGLALTWDPAFTWYHLNTDPNPQDTGAWFQKQHNYSMATLANLFLEDKRLTTPGYELPSWLGGSNNSGVVDPNASKWSQSFKTQLAAFRSRNDSLNTTNQAASFQSLIKGNAPGGLFSGPQAFQWNSGDNQNWENFNSTFLQPDINLEGSTTVPFSDYSYFWNDTGKDLNSLAKEEVNKALAGQDNKLGLAIKEIAKDIAGGSTSKLQWSGTDFYNRYLSPDFGIANGTGTALGATSYLDIKAAYLQEKAGDAYVNANNSISSTLNAYYGLKQQIFGGPVVNGEIVVDLRTYDETGTNLVRNLNVQHDQDEIAAKTDATGSFVLDNLPDPRLFGNRDGTLDYRDGMTIAGSRASDGSFSLVDSISGSDYEFPLVGLPGGNATLLTTVKYATLLRWRPEWRLAGQTVTPDLITSVFSTLIKDVPRAFLDDSFNPYSALSAADASVRNEGLASIKFAYAHLAVIKLIDALFDPDSQQGQSSRFALLYDDPTLWGRSSDDPLDANGADHPAIVAFSAYGWAIQESFSAEEPFDPGNSEHLRRILVNILASYPTKAIFENQQESFKQQFVLGQATDQSGSSAARESVKKQIEAQFDSFLTNLSSGLSTINATLEDRFAAASNLSDTIPAVGTQMLIPTISGPKRFLIETLNPTLIAYAQQHQMPDDFTKAFNKIFFTPLTVDDSKRTGNFKLSVTVDDGKSVQNLTGSNGAIATFKIKITDANGEAHTAPDYGLAVRFRLGGSAIEGVDFDAGDDLSARLISIAPGTSEATVELPINPAALQHGKTLLQLELLSADSGYVVDANRAVASIFLGSDGPGATPQPTGQRSAFIPHHLISSQDKQEAWLTAAPNQDNAVLRGQTGRKDHFVIGGNYRGLPHIENFEPTDGDKVLFDAAIWADSADIQLSREQLNRVVNTFGGYVWDLVTGRPLALISNYSTATGDQAWTGLSSDAVAPYFDLAPADRSAGVSVGDRTLPRGSTIEIALAKDINSLLNTQAALELVVIDEANPRNRRVVMTKPGNAAGVPEGFTGQEQHVGLIGRWEDSSSRYTFALHNLATGEVSELSAQKPSTSDSSSSDVSTLLLLNDQQGNPIATVSSYRQEDGTPPDSLLDELSQGSSGTDPVIGISLARVGGGTGSSGQSRTLTINMDLFRESAYNNKIGLYLADRTSLRPIDKLTGLAIDDNAGSITTLLKNPAAVCSWLGESVPTGASQVTAEIVVPMATALETVTLLPYLQAGDLLQSIILPMAGRNGDDLGYQRRMNINSFGFEDWIGVGSDFDMDDVIATINSVTMAS